MSKMLLWSPRVLGILVCFFLSLFSLDAFGSGKSFLQALPDFAIHVAPVLLLLIVVAVSWRREWVGGLVFTGLAAVYAYDARSHTSWVFAISGPLLIVGILFFWSWIHRRELRADAGRSAA
jgi:fatty-acid desaturase